MAACRTRETSRRRRATTRLGVVSPLDRQHAAPFPKQPPEHELHTSTGVAIVLSTVMKVVLLALSLLAGCGAGPPAPDACLGGKQAVTLQRPRDWRRRRGRVPADPGECDGRDPARSPGGDMVGLRLRLTSDSPPGCVYQSTVVLQENGDMDVVGSLATALNTYQEAPRVRSTRPTYIILGSEPISGREAKITVEVRRPHARAHCAAGALGPRFANVAWLYETATRPVAARCGVRRLPGRLLRRWPPARSRFVQRPDAARPDRFGRGSAPSRPVSRARSSRLPTARC